MGQRDRRVSLLHHLPELNQRRFVVTKIHPLATSFHRDAEWLIDPRLFNPPVRQLHDDVLAGLELFGCLLRHFALASSN